MKNTVKFLLLGTALVCQDIPEILASKQEKASLRATKDDATIAEEIYKAALPTKLGLSRARIFAEIQTRLETEIKKAPESEEGKHKVHAIIEALYKRVIQEKSGVIGGKKHIALIAYFLEEVKKKLEIEPEEHFLTGGKGAFETLEKSKKPDDQAIGTAFKNGLSGIINAYNSKFTPPIVSTPEKVEKPETKEKKKTKLEKAVKKSGSEVEMIEELKKKIKEQEEQIRELKNTIERLEAEKKTSMNVPPPQGGHVPPPPPPGNAPPPPPPPLPGGGKVGPKKITYETKKKAFNDAIEKINKSGLANMPEGEEANPISIRNAHIKQFELEELKKRIEKEGTEEYVIKTNLDKTIDLLATMLAQDKQDPEYTRLVDLCYGKNGAPIKGELNKDYQPLKKTQNIEGQEVKGAGGLQFLEELQKRGKGGLKGTKGVPKGEQENVNVEVIEEGSLSDKKIDERIKTARERIEGERINSHNLKTRTITFGDRAKIKTYLNTLKRDTKNPGLQLTDVSDEDILDCIDNDLREQIEDLLGVKDIQFFKIKKVIDYYRKNNISFSTISNLTTEEKEKLKNTLQSEIFKEVPVVKSGQKESVGPKKKVTLQDLKTSLEKLKNRSQELQTQKVKLGKTINENKDKIKTLESEVKLNDDDKVKLKDARVQLENDTKKMKEAEGQLINADKNIEAKNKEIEEAEEKEAGK